MAGVFINLFILLIQILTSIFLKIIKYVFIEKKPLSLNKALAPDLLIDKSTILENVKRLISFIIKWSRPETKTPAKT